MCGLWELGAETGRGMGMGMGMGRLYVGVPVQEKCLRQQGGKVFCVDILEGERGRK